MQLTTAEPQDAAAEPLSRQAQWAAPIALLGVGLVFIVVRHLHTFAAVPGDLGDARFNSVILEHFYRWLSGDESSLLSPDFFFPMPGALMFSDNHLGTAWIYSIFRAVGFDRYHAFDLWYVTGYFANFVAMHVVLRKLGASAVASSLGAFLFAFAMPVSAMTSSHAQLGYRFLAPFALLFLHRYIHRGSPLWLGWCALAVAGQFYMSIYLGYFLVLVLAAWAGVDLFVAREQLRQRLTHLGSSIRDDRLRVATALGMIVAAAGVVCALVYQYLHFAHLYGFRRDPAEITALLPRIRSYFVADHSMLWDTLSSSIGGGLEHIHEHQLFVGAATIALGALALVLNRQQLTRVAAASLVLLILTTLSVRDQSVYLALVDLPGANAVRAVARIMLLLLLPISVLVALAVDGARQRSREWIVGVWLLSLLLVMEAVAVRTESFDIATEQQRVDALAEQFAQPLQSDDVLFVPSASSEVGHVTVTELDGMILAQDVGAKTLNGYSGNTPSGYATRAEKSPCAQARLRVRGARDFHRDMLNHEVRRERFAGLKVAGDRRCAVRTWWRLDREGGNH